MKADLRKAKRRLAKAKRKYDARVRFDEQMRRRFESGEPPPRGLTLRMSLRSRESELNAAAKNLESRLSGQNDISSSQR